MARADLCCESVLLPNTVICSCMQPFQADLFVDTRPVICLRAIHLCVESAGAHPSWPEKDTNVGTWRRPESYLWCISYFHLNHWDSVETIDQACCAHTTRGALMFSIQTQCGSHHLHWNAPPWQVRVVFTYLLWVCFGLFFHFKCSEFGLTACSKCYHETESTITEGFNLSLLCMWQVQGLKAVS